MSFDGLFSSLLYFLCYTLFFEYFPDFFRLQKTRCWWFVQEPTVVWHRNARADSRRFGWFWQRDNWEWGHRRALGQRRSPRWTWHLLRWWQRNGRHLCTWKINRTDSGIDWASKAFRCTSSGHWSNRVHFGRGVFNQTGVAAMKGGLHILNVGFVWGKGWVWATVGPIRLIWRMECFIGDIMHLEIWWSIELWIWWHTSWKWRQTRTSAWIKSVWKSGTLHEIPIGIRKSRTPIPKIISKLLHRALKPWITSPRWEMIRRPGREVWSRHIMWFKFWTTLECGGWNERWFWFWGIRCTLLTIPAWSPLWWI